MIVGDPTGWLARFRNLEELLVERVAVVWPLCVAKLTPKSLEDHISNMLVSLLRRDRIARSLGAIHSQLELLEESEHKVSPRGYLDIAVVLDSNHDTYIAFECKRLNIAKGNGVRASLATEYVKDGVRRYVSEQYADSLPVGAMLGYVLDGDVDWSKSKIVAALKKCSHLMQISPGSEILDLPAMDSIVRFATNHMRNDGSDIEVRHSLLPFSLLS